MAGFDIVNYVNNFKKRKKFQIFNISDIQKILNSVEYSKFINDVYKYYNDLARSKETRLNLQFYNLAGQTIDRFWELLLGSELNEKFQSRLKAKLKM